MVEMTALERAMMSDEVRPSTAAQDSSRKWSSLGGVQMVLAAVLAVGVIVAYAAVNVVPCFSFFSLLAFCQGAYPSIPPPAS